MGYASQKEVKWMQWAHKGAEIFSTCGKRQYMAIVLDEVGHVVATGYNGTPPGTKHCIDGGCERFKQGSAPGSSYDNCDALHAEQNALIRAEPHRTRGGTIIVNGPPCFTCSKLIANSGVARLIWTDDPEYPYLGWDRNQQKLEEWGIVTAFVPYSAIIV